MPRLHIDSIDDPRIAAYRDLPKSQQARQAGLFIAEGQMLVERLLASDFEVESLLLNSRHADAFALQAPAAAPVFIAPKHLLERIVGFNFHRGALACGRRRPSPPLSSIVPIPAERLTIVVCVDVQDPENLGGIIRNAAAFGADAVLLGGRCADAFSRRVLRVSMGAGFKLPVIESSSLADDLLWLKTNCGVQLVATVVGGDARPLHDTQLPDRTALVFGNEAGGLADEWIARCDERVTIPMRKGTDSLNVAVASGIFLHHLTRRSATQERPCALGHARPSSGTGGLGT